INVQKLMEEKRAGQMIFRKMEKFIPKLLFLIAGISIITTVGIVLTLVRESFQFFKEVPIIDFFTGTVLKPLSQDPSFGVLPLLMGTITSSFIAIALALPVGLMIAIYLSEYAPHQIRKICKPVLEVLAGIP